MTKLFKKITGSVTLSTILTVGAIGAYIAGSLIFISKTVKEAVTPVDVKAQTALDNSNKAVDLQKNQSGALKFLVEKAGGEYDPERGIVILKGIKK